ncbi:ABC transporter permease [Clostridium hydrogeniformans]|uniref:ABC transporter permease n=1 Tax=Clostridium hydrogeniformans TaxID=349933 RepID=UPI000482F389|nr:ABC transporter permease [Clostridium hydrogeniformans]
MIIYFTNLKRLFRSKVNLIFIVALPLIFMLIAFSGSNGEAALTVSILDKDNTEFSKTIIKNIEKKANIVFNKEDEIEKALVDGKTDYAIVIPEGYTKDIISGQDIPLTTYEVKEGNSSYSIKLFIDEYLNNIKKISAATKGNEEEFYKGLSYYENGSYESQYVSIDKGEGNKSKTSAALGFIVMNMLFLSTSTTSMIIKDRENNLFTRYFTTPLTRGRYIIENLLSFLTISIGQVILFFGVMKFLFKFNLGESPLSLLLMFIIFSLFTVALGLFITTHSNGLRQSGALSGLINIPFAMLGGCFWPREIMPDILKKISEFIPTTWINKASTEILYGESLISVMNSILLLVLLTMILLILSGRKLKNNN